MIYCVVGQFSFVQVNTIFNFCVVTCTLNNYNFVIKKLVMVNQNYFITMVNDFVLFFR